MPKRAYPFAETFSSQYKMHIGQKELNHHGVFGSKYRQEIYDKTKNLLFSGTKAVMARIWKPDEGGAQVPPSVNQMLLPGQTSIGQDGRLRKTSAAADALRPSAACGVCLKTAAARKSCMLCERHACPSCTRLCSNCSNLCCSICTVVDYTDRYDRVLCCDCST